MSAAAPAPDGKVKQWLMERVGHADAPLGQKWVPHIAQLFIEGEWDESDIVKSTKGREGAKEVWAQILAAAAGKMEKPGPSEIAFAKALRSLLVLSPLYSLEATGDVFITPSRVTLDEPPYEPISSPSLRSKGGRVLLSRHRSVSKRSKTWPLKVRPHLHNCLRYQQACSWPKRHPCQSAWVVATVPPRIWRMVLRGLSRGE